MAPEGVLLGPLGLAAFISEVEGTTVVHEIGLLFIDSRLLSSQGVLGFALEYDVAESNRVVVLLRRNVELIMAVILIYNIIHQALLLLVQVVLQ